MEKVTLPPELLEMILGTYMDMRGDLIRRKVAYDENTWAYGGYGERKDVPEVDNACHLLLVNKHFRDTVIPLLYRDVVIDSYDRFYRFTEHPDIHSYRHIQTVTDHCANNEYPGPSSFSPTSLDELFFDMTTRLAVQAKDRAIPLEKVLPVNAKVFGPAQGNSDFAWRLAAALRAREYHLRSGVAWSAFLRHGQCEAYWTAANKDRARFNLSPAAVVVQSQDNSIPCYPKNHSFLSTPTTLWVSPTSPRREAYNIQQFLETCADTWECRTDLCALDMRDLLQVEPNLSFILDPGDKNHVFCDEGENRAAGCKGESTSRSGHIDSAHDHGIATGHSRVFLVKACDGQCRSTERRNRIEDAFKEIFSFSDSATSDDLKAIVRKWETRLADDISDWRRERALEEESEEADGDEDLEDEYLDEYDDYGEGGSDYGNGSVIGAEDWQ